MKLPEWNSANGGAPRYVFRAVFSNEASHRVHGGQALVARAGRASTLLFQMIEEVLECFAGEVCNIKAVDRPLAPGADVGQQEREGIAIAALSVPRKITISHKVFEEEAAYPASQQAPIRHD
jgi:hypothetical protein